MLLELKNGGIVSIDDESCHYSGCPTCDYGSEYINDFWITLTKYKVWAQTNRMYRYAFSAGDMMRILLGNIKIIIEMTEEDFIEFFKAQILERDDNAKFEVTDI